MQLQLTREELKLLAEVLEEPHPPGDDPLKTQRYDLLDRVIAHDLRFAFDELEDLHTILIEYEHRFRQQLAEATAASRPGLLEREKLLEHVMDKVTEACAMV